MEPGLTGRDADVGRVDASRVSAAGLEHEAGFQCRERDRFRRLDGRPAGKLALRPGRGWTEPSLDLPPGLPAEVELSLTAATGEWLDCHVWIVGGADDTVAR